MTTDRPRRKPEIIDLDDPALVVPPEPESIATSVAPDPGAPVAGEAVGRPPTNLTRRAGWGTVLVAALGALTSLALSLSFARFVSAALERQDWIGWTATGLLGIALFATVVIVGRELVGLVSLRRLGRTRRDIDAALARRDIAAERRAVEEAVARFADRPELTWHVARLREHTSAAVDPGDYARLADRDLMPALDASARRLVASSARRVSVVTALSPTALLTVGWILAENLRLLRALAQLYGGRPGFLGTTRLARMVFTHIVASGGIALTEDLLGQFLGQDLIRRLSRRLGESLFNAALTARVGAAAIEVIRPLPYLEAPRIRARDFITEIARWSREQAARPAAGEPRNGKP
jgi:putative membrane protein